MLDIIFPVLMVVAVIFVVIMGILGLFQAFYKKVDQGEALIVNNMSKVPSVHFTGAMVLPVIHRAEKMRISVIPLQIDRRGKNGLICQDNYRADISIGLYLRVNETAEDVLKVAKSVGVTRASDKEAVDELFNAKFSEALKTVGKQFNFVELFEKRQEFREAIVKLIGADLNGYVLEDVAIDYLEQTPVSELDPNNVMDSDGIRRIKEITEENRVKTNILERDAEVAIEERNTAAFEQQEALRKTQAETKARTDREIAELTSKELALQNTAHEKQRSESEIAKEEAQKAIDIATEERMREQELAAKAREKAVAVEEVAIQSATELEHINRERRVEEQRIEKDKVLEVKQKEIADIQAERIQVESRVAEEEEAILTMRNKEEAERNKETVVIGARAKAEQVAIEKIESAKAEQESAKLRKAAMVELAEGEKAKAAAPGLAEAQVREADALASRVVAEAEAHARTEAAKAERLEGETRAQNEEDMLLAQAKGEEELGNAKASAALKMAEAEAEGITKKAKAYEQMDESSREFEVMNRNLDIHRDETMSRIDANVTIAEAQAKAMGEALANAKMEFIGGDGDVFNKVAQGIGYGRAADHFMKNASSMTPFVSSIMEKIMGASAGRLKSDNAPTDTAD
ncbi:SPFH domain-containing protein [Marinobacter oulmenensis]|uniref:Putative membrane protein YqiK n=1 Tax=Marinobacter oulmenensis TaxID=643747 RepID=A0A840UDJ9_9GAMM|nr:SPFH domain-containing protein [Marinobacter oulmenensis]MBB5320525.1 putative membrane protein YqiK [Marinobacter oulmenensis]